MIVIELDPENLNLLLEESYLPKHLGFTLHRGEVYGFYHHSYLYGQYRLKRDNEKFYFLSKNHYRPLRLSGNKTTREKFLNNRESLEKSWKDLNHIKGHILLTSAEDKEGFHFKFHHQRFSGFCQSITLPKTEETAALIALVEKTLANPEPLPLTDLKNPGSRLFELSGFAKLSDTISRRITYSSPPLSLPSFPIEVLYDLEKEKFIWRENPIIYYRLPPHPRRRLHSFASVDTGEDSYMDEEKEVIKKTFQFKPHFSAQFLTGSDPETLYQAMGTDILHLICHGEARGKDFVFLKNGKPVLTLADISKLPRTPALVVLSNCYSDHRELRQTFWERGTQTLIVSHGPLFSINLPKVLAGFYRRMLLDKLTVMESYHLLIKDLVRLNDINAVKLRLYGYGQEKLFSFKD